MRANGQLNTTDWWLLRDLRDGKIVEMYSDEGVDTNNRPSKPKGWFSWVTRIPLGEMRCRFMAELLVQGYWQRMPSGRPALTMKGKHFLKTWRLL